VTILRFHPARRDTDPCPKRQVSVREVTVEGHHSDRMVALAGERNSLLREIVARMAAKELHDERLIALAGC